MEPRFGYDFSKVRVHADAKAADSAQAVNALAYTVGRNVVFGAGQHAPATGPGRSLMAHELTHVVQQGGATEIAPGDIEIGGKGTSFERDADYNAERIFGNDAKVQGRQKSARLELQRACPAVPTGLGATASSEDCEQNSENLVPGRKVLFCQDSDQLIDGQDELLAAIAADAKKASAVEIHGNASTEGPKDDNNYNFRLACKRAAAIAALLRGAGVTASMKLIAHGPTSVYGPAESNRNTVVTMTTPPKETLPPEKAQEPPAAKADYDPEKKQCASNASCPNEYCQPFPTKEEALADRDLHQGGILSDIGTLNAKAVPLFREFLAGGSTDRQDLSGSLAPEFTKEDVSRGATEFLVSALEAELKARPPAFPPGVNRVTVNILDYIQNAITEIGKPKGAHEMNFNQVNTVPGLIAGGIGIGQAACKVGANPSSWEDERFASGTAEVIRNQDGSFLVTPSITFTVNDTLDFCPGNCGGFLAQNLTDPLSRYEASGISGDLAFTVRFPAPSLVGAADDSE